MERPGQEASLTRAWARHGPSWRFALDALRLAPGETVLDVGCGPGNITRALAAQAALAVGLDASRTMLAQAAREPGTIAYPAARGAAGQREPRPAAAVAVDAVARRLSGIRVFDADEVTAALRRHGLVDVERRVTGFAQLVAPRKP